MSDIGLPFDDAAAMALALRSIHAVLLNDQLEETARGMIEPQRDPETRLRLIADMALIGSSCAYLMRSAQGSLSRFSAEVASISTQFSRGDIRRQVLDLYRVACNDALDAIEGYYDGECAPEGRDPVGCVVKATCPTCGEEFVVRTPEMDRQVSPAYRDRKTRWARERRRRTRECPLDLVGGHDGPQPCRRCGAQPRPPVPAHEERVRRE